MDSEALSTATGWRVHHVPVTASTSDVAAALVADGAAARTLVLADRQTAGRGRGGRTFASPHGGLYASLLLDARPGDLPGRVVALTALATAEAVERAAGTVARVKWPNDVWLGRQKVGGILLEVPEPGRPVVVGIGLNVRRVPGSLPPAVRDGVGALDAVAGRAVDRQALLADLLARVDGWTDRLARDAEGARALEAAWRGRLALIGEEVVCRFQGRPLRGTLEDVSLERGILLRAAGEPARWRQGEHVQDLAPVDRTIS